MIGEPGCILQVLDMQAPESLTVAFFHARAPFQYRLRVQVQDQSRVEFKIETHTQGQDVSLDILSQNPNAAHHLTQDLSLLEFVKAIQS